MADADGAQPQKEAEPQIFRTRIGRFGEMARCMSHDETLLPSISVRGCAAGLRAC